MGELWPSWVSLVWGQIKLQTKVFLRTPISAFFTVILPMIMLVLFMALFDFDITTESGGVLTDAEWYAPALGAFAAASATYTNIGITVPINREDGILKRVRSTPLPPWIYIAGIVGSAVIIAMVAVVIMVGMGIAFYDIRFEVAKLPAGVLTVIVGASAFAALGLALASLVPSASAAPAVANATILPLAFISDVFVAGDNKPRWLEILGDIFPLKHFSNAMQSVFDRSVDAPGFGWDHLAVMAAWGIGGAAFALRNFKWSPRPGGGGGRRSSSKAAAPA